MAWLRRGCGLLDRVCAFKFELKLPEKYKGTFIDKWGKDISALKRSHSAFNSLRRT